MIACAKELGEYKINVNGEVLGVIGRIHPEIAKDNVYEISIKDEEEGHKLYSLLAENNIKIKIIQI